MGTYRSVATSVARFERRGLALLALVALALGIVGFGREAGYTLTFFDRLYAAIQLFVFEYNIRPPDNWPLNVARFLAPAVALYAALLALSAAYRDEVHDLRARLARKHIVVVGLGPAGSAAARSLYGKAQQRVVAIEVNGDRSAVGRGREGGYTVIQGDPADFAVLEKARVDRASHLIVMCGADARNAEVVAAARRIARPKQDRPLRCIVEISDFRLGSLLEEAALSTYSERSMPIEFFNLAERGAQVMLDKHPPFGDDDLSQLDPPSMLVVGLGDMGGSAVAFAAARWKALDRASSLRITVVDRRAADNIDECCRAYPRLASVCSLEGIELDVHDPDFEAGRWLQGRAFTTAYVFLNDDAQALTAALALRRLRCARTIVVRTTRHPNLAALLEHSSTTNGAPALHAFDVIDEVCTPNVLLEGPFELLARSIHDRHIRTQREQGVVASESLRDWESLDPRYRESSRQSAEHIAAKLAAIGCTIARFTDWSNGPVIFTDAEIETMAMLEHERWIGERRATEPKHRSLVPWDELAERERDKDRAIVKEIPDMLARVGFTIVRSGERR
jgi:hypothetical protein